MPRAREILAFALTFLVIATPLGWLFWSAPFMGSYTLRVGLLAVPAAAAMLSSRGFPWKRKLAYAASTLAAYVVVTLIAVAAGIHERAVQEMEGASGISLPVTLYVTFLWVFPLAVLVLFVGKKPQLLWRKESAPFAGRRSTARRR